MTKSICRVVAMWCLGAGMLLGATVVQAETARYDVDLDHSIVEFKVAHMVVSKTTGHFKDYSGLIEMDPESGTVKALEATIKTASVTTNHEKRDAHLRNPDFFDVEKYPTITYKMKSYKNLRREGARCRGSDARPVAPIRGRGSRVPRRWGASRVWSWVPSGSRACSRARRRGAP